MIPDPLPQGIDVMKDYNNLEGSPPGGAIASTAPSRPQNTPDAKKPIARSLPKHRY